MPGMNEQDREFAKLMRKIGVLEDVDQHLIDHRKGVVLVTCGDCDQSYDYFMYEVKMCHGKMVDPRIHLVTLNGGPLLLVKGSPLNGKLPQDEVVLRNVAEAVVLKNIDQVCLQPHNCGKAKLCKYNLEKVFDDACAAHDRTKHELLPLCREIAAEWAESDVEDARTAAEKFSVERITTSPFIHLDWTEKKRKYFFNRDRYRAHATGESPSWGYSLKEQFGNRVINIPHNRQFA